MNTPSQDTQQMLDVMRKAVEKALDRKKRLGQYAVIWQDGKPVLVGEDAPKLQDNHTMTRPHPA
ncbi:MAG: hypothetical protein QJT81_18310 [Candidatus Thiothrix putei]|jgi:hypothetical protein|uniref:Uncharacterized protein n=2 Tax=Thiothrix TaxID=1030 RepID=A0ABY3T683_9GAMM|nr:hypothetical protein [Thiothrix winogradskyi]UJS25913.1 hypothetical protein L2Y54_07675 [Thiothrix winogradskyi]WGZ93719.1 MAG: hypothetical protein QJT81_18310 [Candidatus Thiothrix putei]